MPSLSFLSSSLFLLQALAPVVLGAAIPDDYYPPPHESPDPPARDCDAAGCRDPTWNLDDATLIPDKENVWIITFGRPGKYQEAAKPDINKILSDYLSTSLPYLLNQLSLDKKEIPTLVKDGVPLLIKAVTSITQQKDAADAKKLQEWSRKVEPKSPCGAFAAAAVSAYLVAFDAVYFANNPNGVPTTNDLDYFLMPAYGSMSHDNDMTVHYNAKFPDFFSSQKSSTNVDRNVYVRMDESAAKYRASPSSAGNPDFKKLAHVLLRQFGQVKQWAALDFLDTGFEIRYLKEYCKANFHFLDNQYEKDAANDSNAVSKLLDDPVGAQFFDVWTQLDLFGTLGLPTDRSYSRDPTSGYSDQVYNLNFEKGKLQIRKAGACSRTEQNGKMSAWKGRC